MQALVKTFSFAHRPPLACPSPFAEHIENEFAEGGFEDASFFDEIDNNEAYDDEFIAAGIPEAAPKQRRGAKPGDAEEEAEGDDISAAKEASRLREIEEQMVLEAELQVCMAWKASDMLCMGSRA